MVRDELWNEFVLSGKIEDYLKYAVCVNDAAGGNNGTDKDKRTDNKSN